MNSEQSIPENESIGSDPKSVNIDETSAIMALEETVARLEAEKQGLQNQMLRAVADAQNIQRRIREQNEEAVKFAAQPLVEALLPVLDNFERSIASLESGASVDKVLEGIKAIDRQLKQALATQNVERFAAVGETFDPHKHEALATIESAEHEEGTVTSEVEPGYIMHGRIVRPARVQVTKKP